MAHGQTLSWRELPVSGPTGRQGHAMAYDSERNEVVLFGGEVHLGGHVFSDETWTWKGYGWTQESPSGDIPSPRKGHAMVYDRARGEVVLFGGLGSVDVYYGDTWTWNGIEWTFETDTGPVPRYHHCMAYDAEREVVVLFGGQYFSEFQGETWEWNGTDWTFRTDTGPSARYQCGMAYDSSGVILFGGNDNNSPYNDTWKWDGAGWTEQSPDIPLPGIRSGHAMTYDGGRGVIVLFGGQTQGAADFYDDTWEWNGANWTEQPIDGPSERTARIMAYSEIDEAILLFGGWDGSDPPEDDTWMYSDNTIPTVSEWGLIVMGVLVLTAGTLVFIRRRPAKAQ